MDIIILLKIVRLFAMIHFAIAGPRVENYIPYEATADEIAISNIVDKICYDRTFQQHSDEMFNNRLEETLIMAEQEESLLRYMIDKGMVRRLEWNKMYSGSVRVESNKTIYRFIFKASSLKMQQVDRRVFEDRISGKEIVSEGYKFTFHDQNDSVLGFSSGQGNNRVALSFYPDRRLKSCGLVVGEQYHFVTWDANGKLDFQHKQKVKE